MSLGATVGTLLSLYLLQVWQKHKSFTTTVYIIHVTVAPWLRIVSENHSERHPGVTLQYFQPPHVRPSPSPSAASRWLPSLILRSCLRRELSPEAEVAALRAPEAMKERREKQPGWEERKKNTKKNKAKGQRSRCFLLLFQWLSCW